MVEGAGWRGRTDGRGRRLARAHWWSRAPAGAGPASRWRC